MGIDELTGQFHGQGTWRDSAGNTGDYQAFLTNRVTDDGFDVIQKHIHDGKASSLTFKLGRVAPYIYRVEAAGQDGGFGFIMNDVLRFFVNNHLGSITEIGFQAKAPGVLAAYGFTNRNSHGHYIMWHETLQRA